MFYYYAHTSHKEGLTRSISPDMEREKISMQYPGCMSLKKLETSKSKE